MSDPITLALLGVGTAAAVSAPILASQQQNKVINREVKRARKYSEQAQKTLEPVIADSTMQKANEQIKTGEAQALGNYERVGEQPTTVKASTGTNVHQPNEAWSSLMGAMRAPQEGYNEFTLQQAIKNLRSAQEIQRISDEARMYAGAVPPQLQDAANSYQWLDMLGQGFQMGGMANSAGMFGGTKKAPAGKSYKFIDQFVGY